MVKVKTDTLTDSEKAEILGFPGQEVDTENIPDINYKEAWELSGSTIVINMTTAKEVRRNQLRNERDQCLKGECDTLWIEARSQNKDMTLIEARQQYLRDLPADPAIDAATTLAELDAVTITSWTPPVVKDLPTAT